MSKAERAIPWSGVVVIEDRRVIALKENDKPFYIIPGGKVESGETDEAAAIREVYEELGVSVRNLVYLTTMHEKSRTTGQQIRFMVFRGVLAHDPDPDSLPGKTVAVTWINSRYEEEGIEVGSLPKQLIPILVEMGVVD